MFVQNRSISVNALQAVEQQDYFFFLPFSFEKLFTENATHHQKQQQKLSTVGFFH